MRKAPGKNLIPVAYLALLLTLFSGLASAGVPDQNRLPRSGETTVRLQPHPNAEVIVPNFKAVVRSDGSAYLSLSGVGDVGTPIDGYDFDVDLTLGTYMTRRLSQIEIEKRLKDLGHPVSGLEHAIGNEKAGSYRVRTYLQTRDPIDIVLTETSATLEWDVSSTGTTIYRYGGDYCWADDYTSAATTWYVDYCVHGDLWWSSGNLCNDIEGWYHNYDYGWDDQITTAHQYLRICSQTNGSFTYYQVHKDSGEGESYIDGSFYYFYY